MTLIFWIGFSLVIGSIADRWGRSSAGWFFLALLISPLLAIIVLLIAGKTLEKKAEETVLVEHLIDRMRQRSEQAPPVHQPRNRIKERASLKIDPRGTAFVALIIGIVIAALHFAPDHTANQKLFLVSDFGAGTNKTAEPATATDKWPWLKTAKMTEEEAAQRACFDENERTPDRKEDCSLPKIRERLAKSAPVAPAASSSVTVKQRATKQSTERQSNPTQEALARQVLAMPGESRW
jgi:hypothetical protein